MNKKHDTEPMTTASEEATISKTQQKKLVHSLQDLAQELSQLPKSKRVKLNLPEPLESAIEESHRITSHIAGKRHRQYMAKLLNKIDHQQIREQLEQKQQQSANFQARKELIELWIEQLQSNQKNLLDQLYQNFDRQQINQLRQLLRKPQNNPQVQTKIFQLLQQLDQQHPLPNPLSIN